MKKILLLATGGTIASEDTGRGLSPKLAPGDLLENVPEIGSFCKVETAQPFHLDSTNMRPEHWLTLAGEIERRFGEFDGFVICHGTDTMAYTAAALSYLVQGSEKPVVVTGAQKPMSQQNTDAKINLADSFRFACSEEARGVSIVFGGRAIAGTRARKMRTKSYNAFSSINFPDLAAIQDGRVVFYFHEPKEGKAPRFYRNLNPRVFLLKLIPGADPELLDRIGDRCDAVIIESYGVGGIPDSGEGSFLCALDRLLKMGKTVVMATQVTHEGSDMAVYQVGNVAKERYGLLETFDMTLESAVAKLMWILGETREPDKIRELFYRTVNHDILMQEE